VTDVRKAIAESCDVFFYSVGGGYVIFRSWHESDEEICRSFRLGRATGIDLPGEDTAYPGRTVEIERLGEKWYSGNSIMLRSARAI